MSFASGELGCSLEEAYDMTWAEFRIRSFSFARVRKWEMMLFREVSYEVHTLKYMFGKKRPPKKEVFWPIEGGKKKISDRAKENFAKAMAEYQKKIAERGTT